MESNHSNSAALRAFRVLEVVSQRRNGCSVAEVVAAVELPKQTVHRLVGNLEYAGLLVREPGTRRLQLGGRLERFSIATLMNSPGRNERHAILSAVVESTGETCNLTALAGTDIVYLDRVETSWPLRMMLAPGSHVPLRAHLEREAAGEPAAQAAARPSARAPDATWLSPRARSSTARRSRPSCARRASAASASTRAEHLRGMCGVAVPVMIDRQRACAAVAIQAPEGRMTLDELLAHVPRLREAAEAIGATFGH